jgi:hypothetical protein
MKARSIKGTSPEEIQAALNQTMSDGFRSTLAIVFISVKQDRRAVIEMLHQNGIDVFGATTSGEFISSEISEGGIAIMLLDMNPSWFRLVFLETAEEGDYATSRRLGSLGKQYFLNPAFMVATGWQNIDGEQVIKGIEDGCGGEPTIFGGIAGDDLTLVGPVVFDREQESKTGLLALILDESKIQVSGVATCGWKPIGIAKTVTKSIGNVVYTIDGEPAFDVVTKYLGILPENMAPISDEIVNLGAYYPLQVERENAPPVMRTAQLGNLEDRSLICAGNILQGAKVRFSLPPDFDVIDTVVNECLDVKASSSTQADALIMFSCVSRYLSFGALTSEELEKVMHVWNAPFIGFFSYGEFGRSKGGKHEFHNNTCCVMTLKER